MATRPRRTNGLDAVTENSGTPHSALSTGTALQKQAHSGTFGWRYRIFKVICEFGIDTGRQACREDLLPRRSQCRPPKGLLLLQLRCSAGLGGPPRVLVEDDGGAPRLQQGVEIVLGQRPMKRAADGPSILRSFAHPLDPR